MDLPARAKKKTCVVHLHIVWQDRSEVGFTSQPVTWALSFYGPVSHIVYTKSPPAHPKIMTVLVNQRRHSGPSLLPLPPSPICGSLIMLIVHFRVIKSGYKD